VENDLVGIRRLARTEGLSALPPTAVLPDRSHDQCTWKGDSDGKVSRPHDRLCPTTFEAGTATIAALSALTRKIIEQRGRLDDEDVDRFIAAGFGKDHALEVIAIVAASTITNYTGSVTKTPLEAMFPAYAWAG
jgi:alkylhydroperoxidase family enzyme